MGVSGHQFKKSHDVVPFVGESRPAYLHGPAENGACGGGWKSIPCDMLGGVCAQHEGGSR